MYLFIDAITEKICFAGFSEAEVKYKYADFKPPKVMDWRKREKKKKAALKLQEKKIEQAIKGNWVKVRYSELNMEDELYLIYLFSTIKIKVECVFVTKLSYN